MNGKCIVLTAEKTEKLARSAREADGLALRDIRCPYCGFVITRVFSDVQGHYLAKCRKCKRQTVLNFAYFRSLNGIGKRKGEWVKHRKDVLEWKN